MSEEAAMPEIRHEESETKGRWFMAIDGADGAVPEMTYSRAGETTIIIDHTGVPEAWRGRGYGEALVEHGVMAARERGLKIIALCPFAKAQIMQHPDWQDVLKG